ncbi:MAG: GNAT family N-acetyltransferase [Actinobacteria bacterium]|nr:GNAT family N-acetyltransferase [Actinomycetota bacterium]
MIRELTAEDSLTELTDLLHRSYAALATDGMRYLASRQSTDMTIERLVDAATLVSTDETGALVGTISVAHPGAPNPYLDFYNRVGNSHFFMFGIDPAHQGLGLGTMLVERIEQLAIDLGADELACDTAEHAHLLIAWYTRLGFVRVGSTDWDMVDYKSVLLAKQLCTPSTHTITPLRT